MFSPSMLGLKLSWIKKAETVLDGCIGIVNESKLKPDELWVDRGREIYNNLMQKWLDSNDILMYPTHNEGMSVVAEKYMRTFKGKIYKK